MKRLCIIVASVCLIACAGNPARTVETRQPLDPAVVGRWRPIQLGGQNMSAEQSAQWLYVIDVDGNAVLSADLKPERIVQPRRLSTREGVMTITDLTTDKTITARYIVESDVLTVGQDISRESFRRIDE